MMVRTMKRVLRTFRDAQSGAAAVEFALMMPFLAVLLLGVIEIGRFEYFSILVSNAAHAGVQYGAQSTSTSGDTSGMASAALSDEQGGLPTPIPSPSASSFTKCSDGTDPPCGTGTDEITYVQVTATGTFHSLFNYYLLPQTLTITSTATMPVAQ